MLKLAGLVIKCTCSEAISGGKRLFLKIMRSAAMQLNFWVVADHPMTTEFGRTMSPTVGGCMCCLETNWKAWKAMQRHDVWNLKTERRLNLERCQRSTVKFVQSRPFKFKNIRAEDTWEQLVNCAFWSVSTVSNIAHGSRRLSTMLTFFPWWVESVWHVD